MLDNCMTNKYNPYTRNLEYYEYQCGFTRTRRINVLKVLTRLKQCLSMWFYLGANNSTRDNDIDIIQLL